MYINPFIAGIIFTIFAEFTAAVVYSVVHSRKNK